MKVIEGQLDFFFICKDHEEATDFRDEMRDYGIFSYIDPNSEKWTVIVPKSYIIEKFRKEIVKTKQ